MEHIKELIYKMADDCLIIGHRNSEWTGIGPILEEDIAFSSMAQDQIGHAWALYRILHEELGEFHPDKIAFGRSETQMKNAQLTELPIGEYDFSLSRNFMFNYAQFLRFELLSHSSYKPLSDLAKKVKGELKYHIMHSSTWMKQLAQGTEVSKARMQSSVNEVFPYALGLFEAGAFEEKLKGEKVFEGEAYLKNLWYSKMEELLTQYGLKTPAINTEAKAGGRKGLHTEHLKALLWEMTEVLRLDPAAEW